MTDVREQLQRAQAGDKEARNYLVQENIGLVKHIVSRYTARGVEKEDLFQIGMIGLLKAIVLEGEEDKIKELFRKYPVLHSKFLNIIHIGKYNENELVQLAEGYAKKKGYEISGPGVASLKTLLRERMQDGYSVDYEDIMAIIEEAIASLEKRNMKNLFMTVLDNKYEEAAMFMLQPEDFKNINIPD